LAIWKTQLGSVSLVYKLFFGEVFFQVLRGFFLAFLGLARLGNLFTQFSPKESLENFLDLVIGSLIRFGVHMLPGLFPGKTHKY